MYVTLFQRSPTEIKDFLKSAPQLYKSIHVPISKKTKKDAKN